MLLILIQQIVENLLVEKSDALKVITASGFEADDFVDESVGFVAQVSNVLLPLHLLLDICRIVTDLQFNCVQGWGVLLL